MYIPGVSSSPDAHALNPLKATLDPKTPQDLHDPSLINRVAKTPIAAAAEKPVEEVQRMLSFYYQSVVLQQWLRMK